MAIVDSRHEDLKATEAAMKRIMAPEVSMRDPIGWTVDGRGPYYFLSDANSGFFGFHQVHIGNLSFKTNFTGPVECTLFKREWFERIQDKLNVIASHLDVQVTLKADYK